jgi:hypothetical protein
MVWVSIQQYLIPDSYAAIGIVHLCNDKFRALPLHQLDRCSHRGGPGSNPCLVMWDFVMDKSGAGAGFLRELRFVSPVNLHSICFSTIIFTITRGWHIRPGVAAVSIASQTK